MKKAIYIFLISFALTGCEQFFDSPIPYFVESPEPRLVVNATLSPNNVATVEVSHSVPVFGSTQTPQTLNQAQVVMFENGVFWDSLILDYAGGWIGDSAYFSSKDVNAEANYSVVVKHPDFERASAVTVVPELTSPINFKWIEVNEGQAKFTLPPLKLGEYYYLRFETDMFWPRFRSNSPILEFDDDAFIDFGGGDQGFSWAYVRPEIMNGQQQEVVVEFIENFRDPKLVFMKLFVLSEDLFKQNRDLANFNPDNPFSEPTQIHTNVQNGYGVFSAYSLTTTKIRF